MTAPAKIDVPLQRGGIMALFERLDKALTVDDIVKVFYLLSDPTIRRRLNELEDMGLLERRWFYPMPRPEFSKTPKWDRIANRLLETVILEAGVSGISRTDAESKFIDAIVEGNGFGGVILRWAEKESAS